MLLSASTYHQNNAPLSSRPHVNSEHVWSDAIRSDWPKSENVVAACSRRVAIDAKLSSTKVATRPLSVNTDALVIEAERPRIFSPRRFRAAALGWRAAVAYKETDGRN